MNGLDQEGRFLALVGEGLTKAGLPGDRRLAGQLASYCAMVRRFRRAAGLTAERDERKMTLKMAIEPLLARDFLPDEPGTLLDIGSGAGSPGIALAAACRHLEVIMLEPDRRKSVFIGEVIRALSLENATVERIRLEEMVRMADKSQSWPLIISRAAMKPAKIAEVVGKTMPKTSKMILFLSDDGVKEAGSGPHFRLAEEVSLPWRQSSRVALFHRT